MRSEFWGGFLLIEGVCFGTFPLVGTNFAKLGLIAKILVGLRFSKTSACGVVSWNDFF